MSHEGSTFYSVSTGQIRGRGLDAVWSGLHIIKGIIESLGILGEFKPDLVIGVGGYVSFPVGVASVIMRKKVLLHEQNSVPGSTNRFLGKFAVKIFTGFKDAGRYFLQEKAVYTGNPVRYELVERAFRKRVEKKEIHNLLVLGGSSGARPLNSLALDMVTAIRDRGLPIRVYHQTGKREYEEVRRAYEGFGDMVHPFPFSEAIGEYYELADYVVARAGAVTISEISCFGLPAVLIPYPYAADDHQAVNAREYMKFGCGIVMEERDVDLDSILDFFLALMRDEGKRERCTLKTKKFARPFAADEIARICIDLA